MVGIPVSFWGPAYFQWLLLLVSGSVYVEFKSQQLVPKKRLADRILSLQILRKWGCHLEIEPLKVEGRSLEKWQVPVGWCRWLKDKPGW